MLFPSLLPLAAVSWMSVAPAPAPGGATSAVIPPTVVDAAQVAIAEAARLEAADGVDVILYDENHPETVTLRIGRDGSVDDATRKQIQRLFRCKRTERQRAIDKGLLAMLADVSARYPGKTVEFVSAFRATDTHGSRHYQGRALDFRIVGANMIEVRDYIWTHHKELGLGWYPADNFVHMDHRIDDADIAWTETHGVNHYHPSWAERLRRGGKLDQRKSRVGL